MSGFKKIFRKLIKLSELAPEITPHTLRHSFTSLAADLGYSEPTIAARSPVDISTALTTFSLPVPMQLQTKRLN
jgi:integrase